MINRKNTRASKKHSFRKANYSLRRKLLGSSNSSYPIFLLLLVSFSSLHTLTFSPSLGTVQAALQKDKQTMQTNDYVGTILLAQYPSDMYARGLGFAMEDNYIYTIINHNPTVIDVSNRSAPTFVAEYVVETARMNTLALQGSYLYLASNDGLEILNISDLDSITKVGQCNTSDAVRALVLQEDYAYLAAHSNGLVIVNISDPTQPVEVGCFNDGGDAWDLALKGSLAFVTDSETTLEVIDISVPQNPVKVSHFEDEIYGDMYGSSITLNGSYAYLSTTYYGLFILDITDSAHLVRIGHYYGGTKPIGDRGNEEFVHGIFVNEQYVFEAVGMNGLYILDVSDPSNPIQIGQFTAVSTLYGVFFYEKYLYLQTSLDGIVILNLTFYSGNPPRNYTGLIIALISIPIIGTLLALPFIIKKKKNRKREKMVNTFRMEKRNE